jgi:hypothetical protein
MVSRKQRKHVRNTVKSIVALAGGMVISRFNQQKRKSVNAGVTTIGLGGMIVRLEVKLSVMSAVSPVPLHPYRKRVFA